MRNRVFDRIRVKSGSPWTDQEHQTLISMLGVGCTRRTIGLAIGRSEHAVSGRITHFGLTVRRPRPESAPKKCELTVVPKQLVIDYYELGWRVLDIGGTTCTLEWRLSRAPEYPVARAGEIDGRRSVLEAA